MAEEFKLNEADSCYEISIDGKRVALTHFVDNNGIAIFDHTETDPAFEGQGIAGRLVQQAMDDIRARGLRVWPLCPFVVHWFKKNPDYADLIA
jgi:predicted GNAT family acetyltransferase